MNKKGLPSKKQWDKIVDEAFSSTEIHGFSDSYERRRAEMQKGIIMDSNNRKRTKETPRRKLRMGAAAGMAAALALVPASVFTVSHLSGNKAPLTEVELTSQDETEAPEETVEELAEPDTAEETAEPYTEPAAADFYARIEQTAEYQNYVYVNYPADGDRINENFTTEFGWLPDELALAGENSTIAGKFHNGYGGGMTPCLYIVPETGIQNRLDNSASFEQYETDDRVIMINYRVGYEENASHDADFVQDKPAHINFGREVWVAFKGTKYVQMFFITDDFSKDDARQIAENIQLVPTDEETGGMWFDRFEDSENTIDVFPEVSKAIDRYDLVTVGDTISKSFPGESVDITINSARYQDNFDGIHTDSCGQETDYSQYLSTDGRIHNQRDWIQYGDGINTVDTAVSSEDQLMKVLVLDVTYTNTGNADITYDSGIAGCICPTILIEDNGSITRPSYITSDGLGFEDSIRHLMSDDMMFSFDSPSKNGGKNHVDIPAGGTADIQLAFLIPENNIGNVYVNITGDDWINSGDPIVDLCAIK